MYLRAIKITSIIIVLISLIVSEVNAQITDHDRHIEVSLRMIAHQVLLSSGDSTSRVLPIVKENDRYRIQFESEFEFMPGELVSTIDRVVKETNLANRYIVEVEQCQTSEIFYSFEMDETSQSDIIPCKTRNQPKACYSLLVTLVETERIGSADPNTSNIESRQLYYMIFMILVLIITTVLFFMRKRSQKPKIDPNIILIGAYHFDKRNTELSINQQKIDLSSKESDLLLLLYNAVNTTVEREVILNMVWGDEGDYVGRTLDVFISKLRKKLEFDSKVKIVNIRGVGYKLVMDV